VFTFVNSIQHKRYTNKLFINCFNLWSTNTSMIRLVVVSDTCRCSTLVWHSYDTCQIAQTGVQKNHFQTLFRSVSDTFKTLMQHVSDKCPKRFFFSASTLLRHKLVACPQRLKMSKQQYRSMRDWKLDKFFSFFFIVDG
jgi:hypothetical protein